MNIKQALQHLIGEVWEIGEMPGYGAELSITDCIKVVLYDNDECADITKEIYGVNAENAIALIDFLQANIKEG